MPVDSAIRIDCSRSSVGAYNHSPRIELPASRPRIVSPHMELPLIYWRTEADT